MLNNDYIIKLRKKLYDAEKKNDLLNMLLVSERILRLYKDKNTFGGYDFAEDMYRVATVFLNTGRAERAIDIYSRAAEAAEAVPNSDSLRADISNNLAVAYINSGNTASAYSAFKEALRLKKLICGEDSEDYIDLLCNVGSVLFDKGDYDKAVYYHFEALNKRTKKDISFADNLNFLGYDFEAKGEAENAISYFKQALAVIKAVNGSDSNDYIANVYYLAGVYEENRQYENALKYYEITVEKFKETGRDEHPYYAEALSKMSNVCVLLENYQRALMLSFKAMAISKKVMGENHIYYANSLKAVADIYVKTGDLDRAIALYTEEVELKKRLLGEKNDLTISSALNLCDICLKNNDGLKAQGICHDVIKTTDSSNPMYLDCLLALVRIYTKLENTELLYSVYEAAKSLEPNLSFDDMLKRAVEKDTAGNIFSLISDNESKKRGRAKKEKKTQVSEKNKGSNTEAKEGDLKKAKKDNTQDNTQEENPTEKKQAQKDPADNIEDSSFDYGIYEQESFDSFFNRKTEE